MITYKDYILPTISIFFKYKNDVDIFIEDSNDEEFYKTLFQRLLGKRMIAKVFSCGCKSKTIKACDNDQTKRNRKRLYIVDGDLDLIFNNNRNDLLYFYVLDRYCIENFLLNEDGIIETLHDIIIADREVIKKQLGYNNWLKSIAYHLIELFLHYSIKHELKIGTKTVSNNVGSFCKKIHGVTVLDISKIEIEIDKIRVEILSSITEHKYNDLIYDRRQLWPPSILSLTSIVSGKDYLLPLLTFRFKKLKGKETYNLKYEALRMRLVKTCNFESLENLKWKIINA